MHADRSMTYLNCREIEDACMYHSQPSPGTQGEPGCEANLGRNLTSWFHRQLQLKCLLLG